MNRSYTLAALLLAFLLPLSSAAAAELRVLTYNIHHGAGTDGKLDLARIAAVIRSASPDLVALNEVDKGVARTERVDQPAVLAKLTEMQVLFEKNIDHEGGEYGNAILSRLPILEHQNYALPSMYKGEQRGVLVAKVELADASPAWFAATHLDYRSSDVERLKSFSFLSELFGAKLADAPAVIAGDFNATPESRVIGQFQTEWTIAPSEATFPAAKPAKRIDYAMVRRADNWRVIETSVLQAPVASDHRPLLVVYEIADENSQTPINK